MLDEYLDDMSSSFNVCSARSTTLHTDIGEQLREGTGPASSTLAASPGSSAVPDCRIVSAGSRDGERKRSSRSGYERVRRDAETTKYILWVPRITMLPI